MKVHKQKADVRHPRELRAVLDAADRRIDAGAGIEHDEFWRRIETARRSREVNGAEKKRSSKR